MCRSSETSSVANTSEDRVVAIDLRKDQLLGRDRNRDQRSPPLSETERVRLQPYLTARILCRLPSLVRVDSLAGV
jgi:hypothetical protein